MTRPAEPSGALPRTEFTNPPAVEVALAVGFQPLGLLAAVELFKLWDSKFSQSFPKVQEQPRVEMALEQFGPPSNLPSFRFELVQTPPLPRMWFLNEDESELLQVQNNWFARNWRQRDTGPDYPHYPNIRGPFASDLGHIVEHIENAELGAFRPTQCELTYINHIAFEPEPAPLRDVLAVFDRRPPEGPLGEPESVRVALQWVVHFNDEPVGRLHMTTEPAIRQSDMKPVTVLTMTARGRPLGDGVEGVLSFLDLAHDYVVRSFVAMTTEKMHDIWGLRS